MKARVEVLDDNEVSKFSVTFSTENLTLEEMISQITSHLQVQLGLPSSSSINVFTDDKDINIPKIGVSENYLNYTNENITLKERLELYIKKEFPDKNKWFTSLDIQKSFYEITSERLSLSTVSTYLSRMYQNEILDRRGNRTQRRYRLITSIEDEREFTHPLPQNQSPYYSR